MLSLSEGPETMDHMWYFILLPTHASSPPPSSTTTSDSRALWFSLFITLFVTSLLCPNYFNVGSENVPFHPTPFGLPSPSVSLYLRTTFGSSLLSPLTSLLFLEIVSIHLRAQVSSPFSLSLLSALFPSKFVSNFCMTGSNWFFDRSSHTGQLARAFNSV